jgi:uncharacterized Rmd1/YagE family protein
MAPAWTPITAVPLERRLDLKHCQDLLPWKLVRSYTYALVFDTGLGGHVYLFHFGAVVHDSAPAIDAATRQTLEECLGCRLDPETSDTYQIRVDPEHAGGNPRVGWDRVVIPRRSPELVSAVALLLAQSAALERYERTADALLDEALALSRDMAGGTRKLDAPRVLVPRVARLTQNRLELARWFYLVDRPDETWEDKQVSDLYDALFENLELKTRHAAMLHKLAAVESATQNAIDLWHGRRSHALEWAIVLLIVVEILLAVSGFF